MNTLTEEEFHDRLLAIQRATRIFSDTGLTHNIATAFQVYQAVLAERERDIFVTTAIGKGELPSPLDHYERPLCPDCGTPMNLRVLAPNDEGVVTQWVCGNPQCDVVLDSDKTIEGWMAVLGKKQ